MPDPKRHKNQGEIFVEATFNKSPVSVKFNLIVDRNRVKALTQDQMKEFLGKELSKISPEPVSGITYNQISFQYSDPWALEDFDYGNILVEIHLPYCLHLPDGYEIEAVLQDRMEEKALIIPTKIWTNKANKDEEKSDSIDFFADDRVVYFKNSIILTPKIPVHSEEGWQQNFTGKNIEKIKDQNGVFRYTRLYIQFDLATSFEELNGGEDTKRVLEGIREQSLTIVNNLIDCYRSVTKKEHIQRLGSLCVNMIYFINHQKGFYTLSPGFGIETAPINRSKKEIEEVKRMLECGEKPDLYNLLLLDAKSSFENKSYALAVVQSFQALEIFLEAFLFKDLQERGDSEEDSIKYLEKNWKTQVRLKDCLKELRKTSLAEADKIFWDKWLDLYRQTRNRIIHKGKEPNSMEVAEMLEANLKVIAWLKSL